MAAVKPAPRGPCEECAQLSGAGAGKQPHGRLVPIAKYRAISAKATATSDYACSVCGLEWRYDRRRGWGRLGS
jgi:hypothetical protein